MRLPPTNLGCIAAIGALGLVLAVLAGCMTPHPVAWRGDSDSVDVYYDGTIDHALPAAREHCAEYGRVPRIRETAGDFAYFDCVRP